MIGCLVARRRAQTSLKRTGDRQHEQQGGNENRNHCTGGGGFVACIDNAGCAGVVRRNVGLYCLSPCLRRCTGQGGRAAGVDGGQLESFGKHSVLLGDAQAEWPVCVAVAATGGGMNTDRSELNKLIGKHKNLNVELMQSRDERRRSDIRKELLKLRRDIDSIKSNTGKQ